MHKSHRRIILLVLLGAFCQRALPADVAEPISPLTYVHVYADAAGASGFREEHFEFARGRDDNSSIDVLQARGSDAVASQGRHRRGFGQCSGGPGL